MVLLLLCICLYGSRCSKSFFLGSHFCMQKRIIHSYYIFLLFFFCYQLFKLSFTAYLLSKYLEDNVRNFFICLNLNKKVVLKIIQQHKDLILYHWNCFSISNFYVFRYLKKIACKSIIPY